MPRPLVAIERASGDANSISHGFVRAANGTVTTFDPPGALATGVLGINTNGTILGFYIDAAGNVPLFLRAAAGTFTSFELPGGVAGFFPFYINARGEIVGAYFDNSFNIANVLRTADGTITTISSPAGFVFPSGLNASGAISGNAANQATGVFHGFLQTSNGTVTTFDPPGSTFTNTVSINSGGEITGDYIDAQFAAHGFVFADH